MRAFTIRELHGICAIQSINQKEGAKEFFLIFPKKKNDNLEINEFLMNNINSNHILVNNYVYKTKLIYNEEWQKYKKIIFRLEIQNKEKQTKKNEKDNKNNINNGF